MIQVVVAITAKPGQRAGILDALREVTPTVQSEDGCIAYGAFIDAGSNGPQTPIGPDSLFIIERWRDAPALKAHAASPHMQAYATQVKDLIASRTLHILKEASEP